MDATVVAGPWLAEELAEWGCEKVYQVPFGIRHEHFGPHLRNEAFRQQLLGVHANKENAVLLLITGRLAADKRQDRLVEAAVRLRQQRPLALVVVGDGPERERLQKLASSLDAVTFIPFTKDRAEYARLLASADVLLHGSICETYGFVLVEALTSGTPVVVANQGAAAALAPSGASERYPAFGSPLDVANAVERLLAQNLAECRAKAHVAGRSQPHMDRHFELLFELYANLLAEKRKHG
jgi:alpha-1,6-mannosyltransferase